ncbi:MAG TPA: hypothetical protein PLE60_00495 [Candidatus Latescibacteria bacterium]|nr:hypothetical protein [Candidatus Latescibacterota bacterium]
MVTIATDGVTVRIRVRGLHQLWAFRRTLEIPLKHVKSVTRMDRSLRPPWLRLIGTAIPGLIYAGLFRGRGRREFWDWSCGKDAVQLDLVEETLSRIVVSVDNADEVLRQISGESRPGDSRMDENIA